RGRERWIRDRRDRELDPRLVSLAAVLGRIERALDPVDVAREPNTARQRLLRTVALRQSTELREPRNGIVHLGKCSMRADVVDAACEVGRELHRVDEAEQRPLGVDAGYDGAREELFAGGQHD